MIGYFQLDILAFWLLIFDIHLSACVSISLSFQLTRCFTVHLKPKAQERLKPKGQQKYINEY